MPWFKQMQVLRHIVCLQLGQWMYAFCCAYVWSPYSMQQHSRQHLQ
jgi:hypothetical protein